MTPDELRDAARAWAALDPDPETRDEAEALLAAADDRALADRFGQRLAFGTAGLRGALGAGPNRMNRVVVQQTSAGLAEFLHDRAEHPTAVVGWDGRRNSRIFAEDAAAVLAAAGVDAVLLPRSLPTPVLAFAVRDLGADAGVMITASHNPAADNGYKLYLGGPDGGSQLVPPSDGRVQAAIDRVVAAGALPPRTERTPVADEGVVDRYVAATARVAAGPGGDGRGDLPWVYTPMHGVGLETVRRVLDAAGLPAPAVVAEQAEPDPAFPTAPFPNPEEPGTLDLAFALARRTGAALVLANDPDADRLAVAVPDDGDEDGWRRLTGNDVGLLLGWLAASRGGGGTLACSIVSTPGLARIADRFGLAHAETLTGFKWISRVPGLTFGFEEALGYLVDPEVVRDKDGISALVAVLGAAIALAADGRTLLDLLDEVEAAVGRFDSAQVSLRVDDLARIGAITAGLRAAPPARIGGLAVESVEDLAAPPPDAVVPPTDALRYRLTGGSRLILRPSGTEPKLKAYLDVVSTASAPERRRAETDAALAALRAGVDALLFADEGTRPAEPSRIP